MCHIFDENYKLPKDFQLDLSVFETEMNEIKINIDGIVNDIRDRQDNAMAMEFTKCIGELLRKNGVMPKLTEYTRNFEKDNTFETRYGVSIDELDFSEHDKVFEDKIVKLEKENKALNSYLVQREQDSTDMIMKLKQEKLDKNEKIAELTCENESLKQRIAELENEHLTGDYKVMSDFANKKMQKCEELKGKETETQSGIDTSTPIDCANSLINHLTHLEAFLIVPERYERTFDIDQLEQIAEHLLVYCKHNKECEE